MHRTVAFRKVALLPSGFPQRNSLVLRQSLVDSLEIALCSSITKRPRRVAILIDWNHHIKPIPADEAWIVRLFHFICHNNPLKTGSRRRAIHQAAEDGGSEHS